MKEERGMSPVVGVILMVGIAVLLAVLVAQFTIGIAHNKQPLIISVDFDYQSEKSVDLTHTGGSSAKATNIFIVVSDAKADTGNPNGRYSLYELGMGHDKWYASSGVEINNTSLGVTGLDLTEARITVVWEYDDESTQLAEWTKDSG